MDPACAALLLCNEHLRQCQCDADALLLDIAVGVAVLQPFPGRITALCDFVKNQGESQYDEEIAKEIEAKAVQDKKSSPFEDDGDGEQLDVLFDKAVDIVLETGTASTSFLQRKLSVGYARGAKIIDQLEDKGIIGPANGSKGREILINRQQWLEMQAYSSSQPFTAENTEQMSFDKEDAFDDGIVSENYDDLD